MTVLFECTVSSDECDRAILVMDETCKENNNLPSYCLDTRFTNYITTSGGNDGIIKRMADREALESQRIQELKERTMHIINSQ